MRDKLIMANPRPVSPPLIYVLFAIAALSVLSAYGENYCQENAAMFREIIKELRAIREDIGKPSKDVDECTDSSSVCDVNANCNNTRGSYSCTCKPGFFGDGKTCTDDGLAVSAIIGKNKTYLTNLNNWLSPVVHSVNSVWKRCWHASIDGWNAATFHAKCDGKGPTVTIIRVGGKYIFGGYTSLSWDSSSGYQYDSKAFLFSLVNKPGWAPVKLPQTGKYSSRRAHSINSDSSYGPTFGGGYDIRIYNQASSNKHSYTYLGTTYSPPSGHSFGSTFTKTFLAGSYTFTPDEIETFYETTLKK